MSFRSDGGARVTLRVREDHLQSTGIAHGSVAAFAGETSAWVTAQAACERPVLTSSYHLSLLKELRVREKIRAEASVVKLGRRLVVVECRVYGERGALAAAGTFTHLVMDGG